MMAAAIIYVLPPIALLFALRRYVTAGLTSRVRRADFSMKVGQSGAVTCVTTRCTIGVKPPSAKTASTPAATGGRNRSAPAVPGRNVDAESPTHACRCGRKPSRPGAIRDGVPEPPRPAR
jgi:hypothetical protein